MRQPEDEKSSASFDADHENTHAESEAANGRGISLHAIQDSTVLGHAR
jgi:hypothetical protein